MTRGRRSRSRRNQRFTTADWELVERWLREDFSPEQVAGWLRRFRLLSISHETIYGYVWDDKRRGGSLYRHLRGAQKQRRKRYGHYDSRGRLAGKKPIADSPVAVGGNHRPPAKRKWPHRFPLYQLVVSAWGFRLLFPSQRSSSSSHTWIATSLSLIVAESTRLTVPVALPLLDQERRDLLRQPWSGIECCRVMAGNEALLTTSQMLANVYFSQITTL